MKLYNSRRVKLTSSCLCDNTGVNCETNIDECAYRPCVFGQCLDLIDGYKCLCELPYTGVNCSLQLDPCLGHLCSNGAQCIPEPDYKEYICRCPPGYTGMRISRYRYRYLPARPMEQI